LSSGVSNPQSNTLLGLPTALRREGNPPLVNFDQQHSKERSQGVWLLGLATQAYSIVLGMTRQHFQRVMGPTDTRPKMLRRVMGPADTGPKMLLAAAPCRTKIV